MRNGIVVVDVDGVLCDLVSAAIPVINEQFGCRLTRSDIRMFEMDRAVGVKRSEFNRIFELLDYAAMDPIDGASQGLKTLSARFHIVIGTSRPAKIHNLTKKWLSDNKLVHHSFMTRHNANTNVEKKSDLYQGAAVVIDDDITEVIAASDFVTTACLFDSPWNHSINAQERFCRCHNWRELVSACMSI